MAENSLIWNFIARDKASKVVDSLGEKVGGLGHSIATGFGVAALGGIAALSAAFVNGVKDAAAYQVIANQTAAVIKSTGNVAHLSVKGLEDMAGSLETMSGVDEEIILHGENVLATFTNIRNEVGKGNDIFNQATTASLNMSVALGEDMQNASIQLGKALNDPIHGLTALQRVGVTFSQTQKDQITQMIKSGHTMQAQKVILAELNREFGGAAQAAGSGFSGALAHLKDVVGDTFRSFGQLALPILTQFLHVVADNLPRAFDFAQRAVQAFWQGISGKGTSGQAVGLMQNLATAGGLVRRAFLDLVSTGRALLSFYQQHTVLVQSVVVGLLAAYSAYKVIRGAAIAWAAAQAALNFVLSANPIGIVVLALAGLVAGLIYAYKHSETFRNVVNAAFTAIRTVFFQLVDASRPVWDSFAKLGRAASQLWDVLKPVRDWIVANLFPILRQLASYYIALVMLEFKAFVAVIRNIVWPAIVFIISKFTDFIAATIRVITGIVNMMTGIVNAIRNAYGSVSSAISRVKEIVVGFFSGAKSWLSNAGRDVLNGFLDGLKAIWGTITGWVSGIANWIKDHKGPVSLDRRLLVPAGKAIMQGFYDGLKSGAGRAWDFVTKVGGKTKEALATALGWTKQYGWALAGISQQGSASIAGIPGSVAKWASIAASALQAAGAPIEWLPSLLKRMQRESGGDPTATNWWDVNAMHGDPSRGLMQVIGSTFRAYAGPFWTRGILDPFANIYAAIKYTISRYGSGPAGWNQPGGYDSGGYVMSGWTPIYNGTGKPEHMFTDRNLDDIAERMGGGGSTVVFQHSGPLIGNNVDDWMVSKMDMLRRQRRI